MECAIKKPRIPKEYLGAFKEGHRPNVKEFIDDDYAWSLLLKVLGGCEKSKETLAYITKFNNEFYRCVFTGDDLISEHEDQKERKRAEYYRRQDVMLRKNNDLDLGDMILTEPTNNEDRLIFLIDLQRKKNKSKKH